MSPKKIYPGRPGTQTKSNSFARKRKYVCGVDRELNLQMKFADLRVSVFRSVMAGTLLIGVGGCAGLHEICGARACAPGLERRIAGPRDLCTCEKSCSSDQDCGPDQYCNTAPKVDEVSDVCIER
jgi:hypothetical protein